MRTRVLRSIPLKVRAAVTTTWQPPAIMGQVLFWWSATPPSVTSGWIEHTPLGSARSAALEIRSLHTLHSPHRSVDVSLQPLVFIYRHPAIVIHVPIKPLVRCCRVPLSIYPRTDDKGINCRLYWKWLYFCLWIETLCRIITCVFFSSCRTYIIMQRLNINNTSSI